MSRHVRMVQAIEAALKPGANPPRDTLERLALDYVAACDGVDRRLSHCLAFLRQGLRAEAAHLAGIEPELNGLVGVLSFNALPRWLEVVQAQQLSRPRSIDRAGADSLKEGLRVEPSVERQLDDLLRIHRRLAISRASFAERIAVLRRLAALEPKNPVWGEGLRELEPHRLSELRAAALSAYERADVEALSAIVDELGGPQWLTPVDRVFLGRARKAVKALTGSLARAALPDLQAALWRAYEAQDAETGREFRLLWERAAADAGLVAGDQLARPAEEALAWLRDRDRQDAEEQAYEADVRALGAALAAAAPIDDLERAYQTVAENPRGVPAHLDKKYHERLEAASAAQKSWWKKSLGL